MLTTKDFVSRYANIGCGKVHAPWKKLLLLSVLAGFFIAMGGAAAGTASYAITNASAARIISGMLFPFGLIMVIFTGAELFTGNCLITISVLEKTCGPLEMFRNLLIVYVGNFAGAGLLAAAWVYSGQLELSSGALAQAVVKTATAKCSLPFDRALILGILCNILVCAAVMCALCAEDGAGRAIGALVPVAFFVICGFEHCIANMYYIPAGLLALSRYPSLMAELDTVDLTVMHFLLNNLFPVTIGNIIGGCGFAALIWGGHQKS